MIILKVDRQLIKINFLFTGLESGLVQTLKSKDLKMRKNVGEMTYSDFLSSQFVEAALKRSLYRYMARFSSLVDRADIRDARLSSNESIGRIMRTRSWNWAAFFLGLFWLAYRGVPQWKWLTALFCISLVTIFDPGLDRVVSFVWFGVNVAIAVMGNQYYLMHLRKEFLNGTEGSLLKPSWFRVLAVIVAILFSMAILIVGSVALGLEIPD